MKKKCQTSIKVANTRTRRQQHLQKQSSGNVKTEREDAGLSSFSEMEDGEVLTNLECKLNGSNASTCKKLPPSIDTDEKWKNLVDGTAQFDCERSGAKAVLSQAQTSQSMSPASYVDQPAVPVSEALMKLLSAVKNLFNQVG